MKEFYGGDLSQPTAACINYYFYESTDDLGRFVFRYRVHVNGGPKIDSVAGYYSSDSRGNIRYKLNFLGKSYSNAAKLLWILRNDCAWPVDANNKHLYVDHCDGNSENNFVWNIRPATVQQNTLNSKLSKNNTSGYVGVSWKKNRNKWEAYCRYNNKNFFCGYYTNASDAALAYNAKMIELHGSDNIEFLRLNFIDKP